MTTAAPDRSRMDRGTRTNEPRDWSNLPSMRLVQPPRRARRVARILFLLFLASPVLLAFVPWQQSVSGGGTVVAFNPVDRPQEIDAPIGGRIRNWFVVEGSAVKTGDPIVEIVDNDPNYLERLRAQRDAIRTKLLAYEEKVRFSRLQIELLERARDLAVQAAENHVEVAVAGVRQEEESLKSARAALERDSYQVTRLRNLERDGLAATQDRELAERDYKQSVARVNESQARLSAAQEALEASKADLARVRPAEDAKIQDALGYQQAAIGELESTRKELNMAEVLIDRQLTQKVTAPRDGIILRILANKTLNGQIAAGEPLVLLVPQVESRVAEIYVDGNDAPLIREGDPVRLQFEGWPAVQFVGWPSVAVGTFAGRVLLVDATSNATGKFRVLVEPGRGPGEEPWPSPRWLRQGVRAKGFVLLQRVRLGWEIWRRLNGFPPVVADDEPGSGEKVKVKRPK